MPYWRAMTRRTATNRVRRATLGERFDPRHNSLNALRLLLALLVIVSHSWPIGGFGPDPSLGDLSLGTWAVAGFFAISGFLITSSRLRSSFFPYLWRRCLRIFPGLWVCLFAIVVVFVPVAIASGGSSAGVDSSTLSRFVFSNGFFVHANVQIGSTLQSVPFRNSWDGSLWTLRYEFGCYLLLGIVMSIGFVRRRPQLLAVLFVCSVAMTVLALEFGVQISDTVTLAAYLATYFFAGSLLFVHANRIRLDALTLAVAMAWLAVAIVTGHAAATTALPLALVVMALGVTTPLQRIGSHNDISYGVYIYAFPIQQVLVILGIQRYGVGPFIVVAIAATLPVALASWFLVERRALRLKDLSRREVPGLRVLGARHARAVDRRVASTVVPLPAAPAASTRDQSS